MTHVPYEIGSEAWVKAQIAAKLNPEEHDRPPHAPDCGRRDPHEPLAQCAAD